MKVGLFTSPHIVEVRERVQINGSPLCETTFARYFFELWHALETFQNRTSTTKPLGYFPFLTVLSFHVFKKEAVDVAVYETGVGGEYDVTNVIQKPVATGITSLAIDHVTKLGNTIEEIAWHKSGIFKPGCRALTVQQSPAALNVLQERAEERRTVLEVVPPDIRLSTLIPDLEPHQVQNASLAIALYRAFTGMTITKTETPISDEIAKGLQKTLLKGRYEIVRAGGVTWYLDIAHTAESLSYATKWFFKASKKR